MWKKLFTLTFDNSLVTSHDRECPIRNGWIQTNLNNYLRNQRSEPFNGLSSQFKSLLEPEFYFNLVWQQQQQWEQNGSYCDLSTKRPCFHVYFLFQRNDIMRLQILSCETLLTKEIELNIRTTWLGYRQQRPRSIVRLANTLYLLLYITLISAMRKFN